MKAKLLTKLLNDTQYRVTNNAGYIAVGSPLCHDLIKVTKHDLKLSYALDTFREGRQALSKGGEDYSKNKLLFIWDKLAELIESGLIKDIIEGNDEIKNPISVFSVEDGKIIEEFCEEDEFGWPHTTHTGFGMYNNTHFKTKEEAIDYGIEEYSAVIKFRKESIQELEEKLNERRADLEELESFVKNFRELKKTEYGFRKN